MATHTACTWIKMAKKLATSDLPFQGFEGFIENPLFVLWLTLIINFMHGFKSAILAIFHFWQNGTFEPLNEINLFFAKNILLKCYETVIN
jgi:hypothetical protein